ncbi:hypothetical protein FRC18_011028 [Serendipita sp. 400]|nr:hypothetical protein FRC18_011028 [Serendipita sp. 400]
MNEGTGLLLETSNINTGSEAQYDLTVGKVDALHLMLLTPQTIETLRDKMFILKMLGHPSKPLTSRSPLIQ